MKFAQLVLAGALAVLLTGLQMQAQPAPVRLGGMDGVFDELVSDGTRLWAWRHYRSDADGAVLRRFVTAATDENGDAVTTDALLPTRSLRVIAAEDGTLYAVVKGPETPSPSVALWRCAPDGVWEDWVSLRAPHPHRFLDAEMVFRGGSLVVALAVESAWGDSGFSIPDEPLRVIDLATGTVALGPAAIVGLVGGEATVYGNLMYGFEGGYGYRPVRSTDGLVWIETAPLPLFPINDIEPSFELVIPEWRVGERWLTLVGNGMIDVKDIGGESVRYPLPLPPGVETHNSFPGAAYSGAMVRDGESFFGWCWTSAPWPSVEPPDRHWLIVSNDFLFTFEDLREVAGPPPFALRTVGEAFYYLRAEAGQSVLYRMDPPTSRQTVLGELAAPLVLRPGTRTFADFDGSMAERSVLDLTIPAEAGAGAFYQVRTSTDLETWVPLGLPSPVGVERPYLFPFGPPRRFFR